IQYLQKSWKSLDITVEEGIKELTTLCANEITMSDGVVINEIPTPRESIKRLLEALKVRMPKALPHRGIKVTTKRKLTSHRKTE
ncbi:MAG: hypothetical protein N2746_01370, partial [Deltaproteobacteria bacterium]|nr:hypothetical protein [Deltaproteobacteria bacterium]